MGITVGVIGTGRLGREHVRVLSGIAGVDAVGCYDRVPERALAAARDFGARAFAAAESLISESDAVCIVVPTTEHARFATAVLDAERDVFVEKPLADSVDAAEGIAAHARAKGRVVQVGHVERFNGALEKVRDRIDSPTFIEIHRLAPFSVRGTDVSVVGDLMIHDLDLLFFLLGREPAEVWAKGAGVLTEGPDIVNVRLEYPDGCVANVTASRVSVEPLRKVRIFSQSRYLSIDLLRGIATEYRKTKTFDQGISRLRAHADGYDKLQLRDFVESETFVSDGEEPLRKELAAFCRSVSTREPPPVTAEDGLNAVRLASRIVDIIRRDPHRGPDSRK
jgi:predicted dehydrogenase